MKIWLVAFVMLSSLAWAESGDHDAPLTEEPVEAQFEEDAGPPPNWLDASQTVAANQAQALVEWVDGFFGDPSHDTERAGSFLRLEFENERDEDFGNDFGVKLRGKVQLPRLGRRVSLVFADSDTGVPEDQKKQGGEDRLALQYKVRDKGRVRLDATMGYSSSQLKPGVRFRNKGDLENDRSYRYVQRIQYADDEKFFTLGQVDLYQTLSGNKVARWSNRVKWGEHTDGAEWRTRLSLFQRRNVDSKRPLALNYFGTITGETRPESFVNNYKLGVLWRRQVYRDFLFFEIEPAMNYRRPEYEDDRETAWSIVLRLEVALFHDRRGEEK